MWLIGVRGWLTCKIGQRARCTVAFSEGQVNVDCVLRKSNGLSPCSVRKFPFLEVSPSKTLR